MPMNQATLISATRTGASRYFILISVTVVDHAIESDLLELRRELAWNGEPLTGGFHATNDKRHVRDQVFAMLARHEFRVDATIFEKRKATLCPGSGRAEETN